MILLCVSPRTLFNMNAPSRQIRENESQKPNGGIRGSMMQPSSTIMQVCYALLFSISTAFLSANTLIVLSINLT